MMLLSVSCSFHDAALSLRERLAFEGSKLALGLDELTVRFNCDEAIILSTCNRVELYLGAAETTTGPTLEQVSQFLCEFHGLTAHDLQGQLHEKLQASAVQHLFRVASSLESMLLGEGQIAAQVKQAYETAQERGTVGPLLHALFQRASVVAKRIRTQTGIAQGKVSISSAAVDYVREVFERLDDKSVLVLGAGKMGELTLKHLQELQPRRILVTNRTAEKAQTLAAQCGGASIPWAELDNALAQADVILSTTGAPEPIITQARWQHILTKRSAPAVIIDIAVPRDFAPEIHDGDRTWLFNIDDLRRTCEQSRLARQKHVVEAERIVSEEVQKFLRDWARRRNGPVIAKLMHDADSKRQAVLTDLLGRLQPKLSEEDKQTVEKALHLFQNRLLHGPISALAEEAHEHHSGHTLLDALRKLFRLE